MPSSHGGESRRHLGRGSELRFGSACVPELPGEGDRVVLRLWERLFPQLNLEEIATLLDFHANIGVKAPNFLQDETTAAGLPWDKTVPPTDLKDRLTAIVPTTLARTLDLSKLGSYEVLLGQLAALDEAGYNVVVHSFNWDTAFEIVAEKFGRVAHWYTANQFFGGSIPRFVLHKPHGSLGFEVCMNAQCKNHLEVFEVGNREAWYSKGQVKLEVCPACNKVRELFFMPPRFSKELPLSHRDLIVDSMGAKGSASKWYAETWRAMYIDWKEAAAVFSLGYSWPASDYQMGLQASQAFQVGQAKPVHVVSGPFQKNDVVAARRHTALQERVEGRTGAKHKVTYHTVGMLPFLKEKPLLDRLAGK